MDAKTLSVRLPCYDQPPGPHSVQSWVGHSGTEGYWTPEDHCPYTEQVQPQGEPKASCPTAQSPGCGLGQSMDEMREHGWCLGSMTQPEGRC